MPGTSNNSAGLKTDYPSEYDVPSLKERRSLWMARMLAFCVVVLVLGNIAQSMAIFSLTPLKETRPYLVQFAGKSDVVATISEFSPEMPAREILTESLVRQYVIIRHTIMRSTSQNSAIMESRWSQQGFMGLSTSPSAFRRFAETSYPYLAELIQKGARQDVHINSVANLGSLAKWQVEFTIIGYGQDDSKPLTEEKFVATLEVDYQPKANLTHTQMLQNPLGFTVLNYSLSKKAE